ncbi:MAG TPA: alanine racemase [Bacillota bacterium]|nr:alanine racemase [Bacillota bacterium]HPT67228.1 alanine racemase [Bacillota bacterium]
MARYKEPVIRPVWAEINLQSIKDNICAIQAHVGSGVQLMAVVKAEAYGHGAVEVAKAARSVGVHWFGVSLPEEGIALRKVGITEPILVFGPLQTSQVGPVVKYDLTSTVCLEEAVRALSSEAVRQGKTAKVHVKIDTGMGRVGVLPGQAVDFVQKIRELPGIEVEGIFSHFATADEADLGYAYQQLRVFNGALARLGEAGISVPVRHIANSGAIIGMPEAYFDLVRPGIILYGLYPSDEVAKERIALKPAFSLKTRITHVKKVPAGTGISYGQIYHTKQETGIATIPIGYADGWSRLLSGKAHVLIHGRRFPIVGRICMDQCMVEIGDEPVKVGEEVVLIGRQGDAVITVEEVAGHLGTINYEVICMISDRVPRVFVGN